MSASYLLSRLNLNLSKIPFQVGDWQNKGEALDAGKREGFACWQVIWLGFGFCLEVESLLVISSAAQW